VAVKLFVIEAMRNTVSSVGNASGSHACAPVSTNSPSTITPHEIEQLCCAERSATNRSRSFRATANDSSFIRQSFAPPERIELPTYGVETRCSIR
jgi:hypothetical protein